MKGCQYEFVIDKEKSIQLIADHIKGNIASFKVLEYNGYYHDETTAFYRFYYKYRYIKKG